MVLDRCPGGCELCDETQAPHYHCGQEIDRLQAELDSFQASYPELPLGWQGTTIIFSPRDLKLQGGDPVKVLALIDSKLNIARERLIRDLLKE